jgi:hypothetical protein
MAYKLYIVPAIGGGGGTQDARRPTYIHALQPPGAWMDYGFQPIFLCGVDLSPANDAAVVANADVFAFPVDLDTNISGGAINATRNTHEAFLIPLQSVPATYRLLARYDAGLFQYMQRLHGMLGNQILIEDSAKLNIQWQSIPINTQTAMLNAAQSFSYDTAFITNTTQLRAILKVWADAWGNKVFQFGLNFSV